MNQKGIVGLLLTVIILVAGIGVAVYLSQKPQIFKPKAAETYNYDTTKYGSTPISEAYKYPRPADHIQIAENLFFISSERMIAIKDYLRSQVDFLWLNTGSNYGGNYPTGLDDFNSLWADISLLKAAGSKIKVGLYSGGVVSPDSPYPVYTMLADQDILHLPNGTPVKDNGSRVLKVINAGSPQTRTKNAEWWKNVFLTKGVDGVMYDSYSPAYYGSWVGSLGASNGCLEGPCNTSAYWRTNMSQFTKVLSDTVGPLGKSVLLNGLGYYPYDPANVDHQFMGPVQQSIAAYGTGLLSEHIMQIYENETQFKAYIEAISNLTAQNKEVFFWAEPDLYPAQVKDLNLERFYLASYLLIQKNPYTWFGYHPGSPYRAFDAAGNPEKFFYPDWNLDFGKPLNNTYGVDQNGNYYRAYLHGVAVVNPGTQARPFALAPQTIYMLWDPCSTTYLRDSVTVPPKTGIFLFYQNVCKTPTTLTAPASVSTSQTQTTFSWNIPQGATGSERVNPYEVGAPDSQPLGSVFLSCTGQPSAPKPTGSCTIPNLFPNPAKKYEYRMFAADGVTVLAKSNPVEVIVAVSPSPSASPSPSSSTSPSPTTAPKLGDTDGDGDVDIFDYNLVLGDFGKTNDPNTKADLDNDNDVDIFDYNILLGNFGK